MLVNTKRDRRSERHEATVAEILDAAWNLVRLQGLAGLAMRDLAERVGMQAPSLYSYFKSKHAIYDAMFAQGAQAYLDQESALVSTGEALADLRVGMKFFVEFCTQDPARYQLMFQRTIPGFEPSPVAYALSIESLARLRLRLAGIGVSDPRALDLLTALGTGITDQQISNDPGGDRWISLIDEAMEMYLNYATAKTAQPKETSK